MFEVHTMTGRIGNIRTNNVNGKEVVNIDLATNPWGKEEPTWWELSLWGKNAENFSKLESPKGKMIQVVCSSVTAEAYKTKDGEAGASLKAIVDRFVMLTPKGA